MIFLATPRVRWPCARIPVKETACSWEQQAMRVLVAEGAPRRRRQRRERIVELIAPESPIVGASDAPHHHAQR